MAKDAHTDLFPWILGGLLLIAGAVPAAIYLTRSAVSGVTALPSVMSAPGVPSAPVPTPAVSPATSPGPVWVPADTGEPAHAERPGQIWQCSVNGQQTFSDAPCGAGASLRQLNPVNRMDPTPVPPTPTYGNPDGSGAPPDAMDSSPPVDYTSEPNDVYANQAAIIVNSHRREHRPRPHRHDHPPVNRQR